MRVFVSRPASLVSLVLLLAGCGGGDYGSGPTPPGNAPAPNAFVINITSQNGTQSFSPNPASAGGQMVVFRNADSIVHRVVLNDGSVDTGNIAPGATSAPLRMPATGTNYHCSLHPGMVGAVNTEAGAPPPPCEGPYCEGIY